MDSSNTPKIEIFFLPFVGGGHLIPMIDLARLFATHGVKSTIIAVRNDAVVFHNAINRDKNSGLDIHLHTLQLPPGDNLQVITSADMSAPPFTDTSPLQSPLTSLLLLRRPDCIVTDTFHRWAADAVDEIGIPRVIFNGNCCFSRCCEDRMRLDRPHEMVDSDSEPFLVPGLPDLIKMTRSQLPIFVLAQKEFPGKSMRSEQNSFGQVVNSFYELEPAYVEYYRNEMKKKAWVIGPVSLCNRNVADKAERGQKAVIDQHSFLNWLDSQKPNSVIYVSFGSLARLKPIQLLELAHGLETSNCSFIWVVGKIVESDEERERGENWIPDGFEERMRKNNRGLIIKGWAPQLLILEHVAIGGFMTHCGWNSTLEGVCAGVPMITWPLSAEQFYNEKLVTDVLRIGVRVGSEEWASWNMERKTVVGRKKVEVALKRFMGEATEMRRRVKELSEKGKRAVEEGGSSYNDVEALIEELKCRRRTETGSAEKEE